MKRFSPLLFLLFLCACTRSAKDPRLVVITKVNGNALYYSEFLETLNQLKADQDDLSLKNPKVLEQLKTRALNEIILQALLEQQAVKYEVVIAKEEVEGRLSNWKDGYPPGGFEEMLKKYRTTESALKRRIENQMRVEKLTAKLLSAEVRVSDEELKRYFAENGKMFVRPERAHVFQIVVPTKEEALKIRQEVLSGKKSFESAARQYSLSPDAQKGGDLGFFARNEKIAAFDHAFELSVGTLSQPIASRYGVHLLKVTEKQPSKKLQYQDAKEDIAKRLRHSKETAAYKDWLKKLLKDADIYRNDYLFEKT